MRFVDLALVPGRRKKGRVRPELPAMVVGISEHAIERFRVRAPTGADDSPEVIAKTVRAEWAERKSVLDVRDRRTDLVPVVRRGVHPVAYAVVREDTTPASMTGTAYFVVTVLSQAQVHEAFASSHFRKVSP